MVKQGPQTVTSILGKNNNKQSQQPSLRCYSSFHRIMVHMFLGLVKTISISPPDDLFNDRPNKLNILSENAVLISTCVAFLRNTLFQNFKNLKETGICQKTQRTKSSDEQSKPFLVFHSSSDFASIRNILLRMFHFDDDDDCSDNRLVEIGLYSLYRFREQQSFMDILTIRVPFSHHMNMCTNVIQPGSDHSPIVLRLVSRSVLRFILHAP